jgi:hypothetical protein
MVQTLAYLRPIFHEEQDFRGSRAVYFLACVFGILGVGIAGLMLALGVIVWPALGMLAAAGAIVAGLIIASKMTTVVDAAGVHVRYFPFLRKTFPPTDIATAVARTYHPMEYGGWGVRGFPGRYGWAYIVRGNRGVQVEFRNGNRLMLGSQRAEELARAIAEATAAPGAVNDVQRSPAP